jgi:hypothetical protein
MARKEMLVAVALSCGLSLAGSALADDLTPPPWRFGPDTTFQHWDFTGGPAGGPPDAGVFNPFGVPTLAPAGVWLPVFSGRTAVWDISSGSLSFTVPNDPMPPPHAKELWLQVTFFAGTAGVIPPALSVISPLGPFGMIAAPAFTPLGGGWVHELTKWGITQGCPQFERVTISSGQPGIVQCIDQVVIDTRCFAIPAPGSAALVAMGGLIALRRKR